MSPALDARGRRPVRPPLHATVHTVDHHIVLNTVHHYGIRGVANNFFRSYLNKKRSLSVLTKKGPTKFLYKVVLLKVPRLVQRFFLINNYMYVLPLR